MEDYIDRRKLLKDLEVLRQGWHVADHVLDLVVDIVKAQPNEKVKTPTFLDWRGAATEREKRRREENLALIDYVEHTTSGLLEDWNNE